MTASYAFYVSSSDESTGGDPNMQAWSGKRMREEPLRVTQILKKLGFVSTPYLTFAIKSGSPAYHS